jgi:exopolysaccharide biosynthesis polyprenyl glycosylphosphotransferase
MSKTKLVEINDYLGKVSAIRHPISSRHLAWILLASDILGLLFSVALAFWLRLGQQINWLNPGLCGLSLLFLVGLYVADAYRIETQAAGLRALRSPARVIISNLIVGVIIATFIYLAGLWGNKVLVGRGILLPSWGLFTVWAVMVRLLIARWVKSSEKQSRWIVLGGTQHLADITSVFASLYPDTKLVFLAEDKEDYRLLTEKRLTYLPSLNDLQSLKAQPWSGVLLATKARLPNNLVRDLMDMRLQGTPVYSLPDFCGRFWLKVPSWSLQDRWFAFSSGFKLLHNRTFFKLKRLTDVVIAGLLLLLLSPVMTLVAIAIKLDSPGSVFYSQERTGLKRKLFKVYKFRSMYQNAEAKGVQWASQRDPRITRVGRWIRLTRIDELPQLWNVLQGEMSLIGPRPERPNFDAELEQAIPYYNIRYLVAPGISGWAQVMYPYGASIEDAYEKLAYDLYYIKNYSLFLDLEIALRTLRVVLLGKGR